MTTNKIDKISPYEWVLNFLFSSVLRFGNLRAVDMTSSFPYFTARYAGMRVVTDAN
jgi:hypothetical protein